MTKLTFRQWLKMNMTRKGRQRLRMNRIVRRMNRLYPK